MSERTLGENVIAAKEKDAFKKAGEKKEDKFSR